MVVLMNQALDPRFKVTVALAPLVNFIPPKYGFNENFNVNYIPINLLNEQNSQNLLIIHHVDDEALDFSDNALIAKELTNCSLIPVSGFLLGANQTCRNSGGSLLWTFECLDISKVNYCIDGDKYYDTQHDGVMVIGTRGIMNDEYNKNKTKYTHLDKNMIEND